ncbi:sialidase family protein [Sphingobacterium sp. SGR-19]|uniref:sialidase family protein n=1 Tax=Sphingobacterium sp. SGR-19 TaxID=2710886 RepID=UPI0019D2D6D3|nr:sialidase family protein [Sphingobacterium sp. SGR-19]
MMKKNKIVGLALAILLSSQVGFGQSHSIKKVKDIIVYQDTLFYNAFPSVIKKKDGEFLVAFRQAPNRRIFGTEKISHVDHNSYLVTLKSKDGEQWSTSPELLYAHAFGGSQDPCMIQLKDGTLLCASYGWTTVDKSLEVPEKPLFNSGGFTFLGGYVMRSTDKGKSWQGPHYPVNVPDERHYDPFGQPMSAYNRGALYETKDGRVLWVVAAHDRPGKTSNYLLISHDKGLTWTYSGVVAKDDKISFNETSVYETPKGDIVAFMRTARYDDQACIARSTDGGKTFKWESMGFKGHPLQAMRLPDDRVFVVYGYRHQPFGIRARILNAECTDFATAEEFVIREDGGSWDIGYPWSVQLDKNRVLVVYYYNQNDGPRYIAGSILEVEPQKGK